jgi:hypothetical protein
MTMGDVERPLRGSRLRRRSLVMSGDLPRLARSMQWRLQLASLGSWKSVSVIRFDEWRIVQ